MTNDHRFNQGFAFLSRQGINLNAVLDCMSLPEPIVTAMHNAQVPLADYQRLVLLGSAGQSLWQALTEFGFNTDDPIDYFAQTMTERFAHDYLGLDDGDYLLLYPGDYLIPLQQLGALAGWHQPSPLGIGIHPEYGLWFAYRAAFLTALDLPVSAVETKTRHPASSSVCANCEHKPCITSCPANAVKVSETLDIPACMQFRLAPNSQCETQCLARLACPIAPQHRYSDAQISYHYTRSLRSIRRYQQTLV